MANNLVDNTNYGYTEGVPKSTANQEPLKDCMQTGDLNTFTTPGFYSVLYGSNLPPDPAGGQPGGWFVIVVPVNWGDGLYQFAATIGGSSSVGVVIYGRTRSASGVWGSWKGIYQN